MKELEYIDYKELKSTGEEVPYYEILKNTSLDLMENEVFRSVVGFDGLYSISNYGRVLSEAKNNGARGLTKPRIRKIQPRGMVLLYENNKPKSFCVSILVADAFISKSRDSHKTVVSHINKNPMDNRLCNLSVESSSTSCKRNYALGLIDHSIKSMADLAIERKITRQKEFGIFENGKMVSRICRRCYIEHPLSEFSHTNIICNNCKSISDGVVEVGKIKKYNELSKSGLQQCSCCHEIKTYESFHNSKHRHRGIVGVCKKCSSVMRKKDD